MTNSQDADFNLTHSIVNYLNAQYRAHFAFVNALVQLSSPDVTKEIVDKTQQNLATVVKWNKDLYSGMPIFSAKWKYPETFDAQKAFDLLNEVKADITKIITILKSISEEEAPGSKPEDLKFLIATKLRFAYGRENFIKGFLEYANSKNDQEMSKECSKDLNEASEEIKIAMKALKDVKDSGGIPQETYESLVSTLPNFRCMFQSYIQDINIYLSIYDKEFTYENSGIKDEEAARWKTCGFDPQNAGYWKAYGFQPEEALDWFSYNIPDPSAAYVWKSYNFTAEASNAWINLGVLPKLAIDLIKHGQTPESVYRNLAKAAEKSAA